MRKAFFAALAAAAVLPAQLNATTAADLELRTAGDLMNICGTADNDPLFEGASGFCYGFLSGTAHYHRSANAGKKGKPLYCLPEGGVSRADAAARFVAWGRANPQFMSEPPVDGLMRFAAATWPCKKAK